MSIHPKPRETKLAAKKSQILNEIFRSLQCSRFDLARRLNINATAVGGYVDDFLSAGMLVEGEPIQSRPGRAPVPLRINPDHGCFLGLDFEALRARAVLCDFAGGILHETEIPLKVGSKRETVMGAIISLARSVSRRATTPLLSVGIAAPGQVDCNEGRILHYRLLSDFDQVPIRDRFAEVFDAPVYIEDNIRALAYAELLRGSGRRSQNFLCLTIRSGVGLGIVIDGKLYGGANAMSGEIGYMVVSTSQGPQLATDLVSATGFVETTRAMLVSWQKTPARKRLLAMGDDLRLSDICAVAHAGDPLLHDQLLELGTYLGIIAANLANVFAPEKIVLAGEVPRCSPLVRDTMERVFRKYTLPHILRVTYLEDGTLGGFAGALGAAWLGFERAFPEDEDILVRRIGAGGGMGTPAEPLATARNMTH